MSGHREARIPLRRWQSGVFGWLQPVVFVAVALALCFAFGSSTWHWQAAAFFVAVLASMRCGWGPAILAALLSSALIWLFFPVPAALTKLWLEIARDVLGLVGAALTARAFFRLEDRKREADTVKTAPVGDPDLKKTLLDMGLDLDRGDHGSK